MKLFAFFTTSLSFIPPLIAAAAIPDGAARNETLVKRGGEVNYLSNCARLDFSGPWPVSSYTASYIAWYSNIDNTHSGNDHPNSLSNEYRNWDAKGEFNVVRQPRRSDYLHWEGQEQDIYFPDSGASVQTHIDGDAQGRGFQAYAGWAQRTSDGKVFNCYKDNGRQIFDMATPGSDGNNHGVICHSIYYCV